MTEHRKTKDTTSVRRRKEMEQHLPNINATRRHDGAKERGGPALRRLGRGRKGAGLSKHCCATTAA